MYIYLQLNNQSQHNIINDNKNINAQYSINAIQPLRANNINNNTLDETM